jgi:hypothetical protein
VPCGLQNLPKSEVILLPSQMLVKLIPEGKYSSNDVQDFL